MDDNTLEVELRLEPKRIPRERIARIIWLHADEIEPNKATTSPSAPETSGGTRVQVVRRDGNRMTFLAESCLGGVLSGKSDVLGTVRASSNDADLILFGTAIEQAAATLLYQTWRLQNAPEPTEPSADGGNNSGNSGLESTLVGKPAPPFTLELLGGGKFDLARNKGKVVVLDFWATWCGPCMQSMPQVDRVVREFRERKQDVQLIAVNLQEPAGQIKPVLERHKLDLTVALDRDGIIADKYGATAIPQTVIVGRDGSVARLFVGSSPRFEEQFREALHAVVDGEKQDGKQTEKENAKDSEKPKAASSSP
jgi:peroxiredoxin